MKVTLKFASDLPCKIKDYEFTDLIDPMRILLQTSKFREKEIRSKGKFQDYAGAVDFDGLVLIRQKSGLNILFEMIVKDGVRSYKAIDGFTIPENPELFLWSKSTTIYCLSSTEHTPRDKDLLFESKYLTRYINKQALGNGFNLYSAVITPITKMGDKPMDVDLPSDLLEIADKAWLENGGDGYGVKLIHISNGQLKKTTLSIIKLEDQEIVFSKCWKDGKSDNALKIDLHNHLLPNVDDGSGSTIETEELIDELKELGVTQIVLTPHDNENFNNPELQDKEYKHFPNDIKSTLSAEHKLSEQFVSEFGIDKAYRLHPYGFILIEFAQDEEKDRILKMIDKFTAWSNKVIVAHVERYKNLNSYDIDKIQASGALIQSNIKSIDSENEDYIVDKIVEMIDHDQIDLLSTDVHHQEHIDQMKDHMEAFNSCRVFNEAFAL